MTDFTNNKLRILMIPSWYPSKNQPYIGKVFEDQATFLRQKFDVRVLFGVETNPKNFEKWMFQGLKTTSELEKSVTTRGLPEYRFNYHSWLRKENSIVDAMFKGYEKMLSTLIEDGWKPDLIQAQCTDPAGIVASRLSARFHIPWVVIEHQAFALSNYSSLRAKLIKQAVMSAPFVAVTSQHQVRCLAVQGLYPNIVMATNLIDEDVFKLSSLPQKNERFRILTLMWYGLMKDPETFFKAIGRMAELGHDDIDVVVIGNLLSNTGKDSSFSQLAEKYHVLHLCDFLSSVTDEELVRQHTQADVFVSTSVAETFGIAVREAMVVGKPVVCTASGGVDDDIFDFDGFKVNIYDHDGIAKALIKIKTGEVKYDPEIIRKYVVSKYGREAFLENMNYIFTKVISNFEKSNR